VRVLAIRGENLASLSGRFAVELADPPLAQAGIFAITGPTGAGKSTILDALCLALFDRTPRLHGRSGVQVGRAGDEHERIGENDARAILRRGAGQGHAEVDFQGKDGRRYRARWSVQRARRKADGALQKAAVELRELESEKSIGGTKTETLAAIEERLGLTFEQFRRSVLLAQGDFAAFLRAPGPERGSLLERMTGTEIYGEISKAAFAAAKREEEALAALERESGALPVFTPEEVAAAEAEAARLSEAHRAAEARLAAALAALRWHEGAAALDGALAEAAAETARAGLAWEAATPLRAELSLVKAALAHRPAVEGADRAAAEAAQALARGALLEAEAASARAAEAQAAQAEAAALEALRLARAALEAETPAIRAALALDARVADAAPVAEAAAEAAAVARRAAQDAARAVSVLEATLAAEEERRVAARAFLDANAALAPLCDDWSRWQQELLRYEDAARAAASVEARRGPAEAALAAAVKAHGAAVAAATAGEAALQEREEARRVAREAVAAVPLADLREERAALEERRARCEALLQALGDAGAAEREAAAEAARAAQATEGAAQALTEAAAAARERTAAEAARDEAESALEGVKAARSLDEQRAALVDGKECPLCGALEHPWGHGQTAFAALEKDLAARLKAHKKAVAEAERRATLAEARRQEHLRAAEDAGARRGAHAAKVAAAVARWEGARRSLQGLEIAPSPLERDAARTPEALLLAAKARQETIREVEARAEALARALEAADRATEAARKKRDAAAQSALAAERSRDQAARALEDLKAEAARALAARDASASALTPAFAGRLGWRARLDLEGERFRAACEREVAALRAQREALERAAAAIEAGRARLLEARPRATERATEALAREADAVRAAGALAGLRAERRALLGGRAAAFVDAEHAARVAAAEAAHATALAAHGRALAAAQGAAAGLLEAQGIAEARRAALVAARAALDAALAGAGVDEATLRARLARGPSWIAAQEATLRLLDEGRTRAAAVSEERRLAREKHEALGKPALSPAEAAPERDLARAALEEEQRALGAVRARIAGDQEARARKAAFLPRIDAQRERLRVRRSLSDMIGSESGQRFRTFAQSLTLEGLTAHANAHLRDLAPRYALERVPATDLELQVVDRHMGDEIRSVNSLSGGEAFLVSLALALGLSSLASRRTRVECLFVDEGFGTLDPDTLDAAMAALDALQASGRTIGLISHVPGLAERIGVQVRVAPRGGGRSEVRVTGGRGS